MRCAAPSRRLPLFLSLALCIALLGASRIAFASLPHSDKKDEKRQIEQLEEQWRVAQIANDVPTLERLLSDDYIGISLTGQVNTKVQQLDRTRNRTLVITSMALSDSKIKLLGRIAIVTSQAEIEGTNEGISMTGTYRYTRVYLRLPSGVWKITNFEATRIAQRHLNPKS
ncbi:nuclear transport factor 2 family protein [Granulicella sp. WH15]|uniref:nuclear transport factor 2 family protein n=1 Tax=Granulicella sp. WH15 TaxID=2602070 RepID=UPI001366FFEC|nr:nuclear transport factor 2 family protein [Granulicella sp. WH15]QHN02466.1 nuclear transport factor 2 family protein [Granulicella sp. WH15]